MAITTITELDHLVAVFGSMQRVERIERELRIVAEYHTTFAGRMRDLLAGDACDAPRALLTRVAAQNLVWTHDTLAANCTAIADTVRRALHLDLKDKQ
jgi:hypothetical protein